MFRCRSLAVAVFAVWTLFVWAQRLVNIANDDLEGFDLAWSAGRALVFVAVGIAVAIVAVRPMTESVARSVVAVASGVTIALWSVQVVLIAARDYDVSFIVVHAVLGVVSVGLAWWAARSVGAFGRGAEKSQSAGATPSARV